MPISTLLKRSFQLANFANDKSDPASGKNAKKWIKALSQQERLDLLKILKNPVQSEVLLKKDEKFKKTFNELENQLNRKVEDTLKKRSFFTKLSRGRKNRMQFWWETGPKRVSSTAVLKAIESAQNEASNFPGSLVEQRIKLKSIPLTLEIAEAFFSQSFQNIADEAKSNPKIWDHLNREIQKHPDCTSEIKSLIETYVKKHSLFFPGTLTEQRVKLKKTALTLEVVQAFFDSSIQNIAKESLTNPKIWDHLNREIQKHPECTPEIKDLIKDYTKQSHLLFPGNLSQQVEKLKRTPLSIDILESFLNQSHLDHHIRNGFDFASFVDSLNQKKSFNDPVYKFLTKWIGNIVFSGSLEQKMKKLESIPLSKIAFDAFKLCSFSELSLMAVKDPAMWMIFSHGIQKRLDCSKELKEELTKLNHWVEKKTSFYPLLPSDVEGQILTKPINLSRNSLQAFLYNRPLTKETSLFRKIEVQKFAQWVSVNQLDIFNLGLTKDELDQLVPELTFINFGVKPPPVETNWLAKAKKVTGFNMSFNYGKFFLPHLENPKQIETLIMYNYNIINETTLLNAFTNLKSFSWTGNSVNRGTEYLPHLKFYQNLESLSLSNCNFLAADLQNVALLPNLKKLKIQGPSFHDALLPFLHNLSLTELDLSNTRVSSSLFQSPLLKNFLNTLKVLNLSYTQVTEDVIDHLLLCKNLESLSLTYTDIDNESLLLMKKFNHLKHLDISQPKKNICKGLRHLAKYKHLESLDLNSFYLGQQSFDHLFAIPHLKRLSLNCSSAPLLYHNLSRFQSLRYLSLDNAHINDAILTVLYPLKDLQFLSVKGAPVTQAGLNALKAAIPLLIIEQ